MDTNRRMGMKATRILCLAVAGMLIASSLIADMKYGEPVSKPLRTGLFKDKLVDAETGNLIVEFWLQVPKKLPAEKHLGLVMGFYGAGGGANPNWWSGNPPHYTRKLGVEQDYIFINPRSKGNGWGKADIEPCSKLLEWVLANYPIDPRRVYCYGFSSGGFFLGDFVPRHKDKLAGCIASAGRIRNVTKAKDAADRGQEFYMICGTDDGHKGGAHSSIQLFKSTGHRYIYRQVDGMDHNRIQGHDPTLTDAFKWLHTLRHKDMAPSEKDRAFLDQCLKAADLKQLWAKPETIRELIRIGGHEAGEVITKALGCEDAEVQIKAAGLCVNRMFGRETVKALAERMYAETGEGVRAAVIKALTTAANWRYEEAQEALQRASWNRRDDQIKLKRAKLEIKRPIEDRKQALQGVAQAAKLQMLGHMEDRILFETLTELLIDPEKELREEAIRLLEQTVKGGYGYRPELKPQANVKAILAWRKWVDETCGKKLKKRRRR
jgi:predicted esterase